MVRRMLAALAALFVAGTLFAQNYKISLKLEDATNGEPVGFATVSATPEKGDPKYALTNHDGSATVEKLRAGKYTLKAEIMGYITFEKAIDLKESLDLGTVKMEQDTQVLDAASVSATGNPIIVKKDTIEYNASSYKISDDNVLEDLLKKLPGVEVDENGTITANGETITKITIGGKTFFLDDPQLASKNIPAKLVDKVKVVKKKSEQAEFTGIDDGEDETVIDLSVKPGMMNGVFGNAMAGGGYDIPSSGEYTPFKDHFRWQGAFMGGRFTEDSQISVIANANNTNNRGFNDLSGSMMNSMMGGGGGMGRGGGGWGNSNGVVTSWMGGANGVWDLLDKKMELGGNYLYNGTQTDVLEDTYKETFRNDGSTLISSTKGSSSRFTDGHRFGVRLEHKFSENTSILFQPQFNIGRGSYLQQKDFETSTRAADGLESKTNSGFSTNGGNNNNWQTRGWGLFRQRLGIPGRTISVNVDWNISNNDMDGINRSATNTKFNADGTVDASGTETVNQLISQTSRTRGGGSRIVYTEPLGSNFYLEGSYNIRYSQTLSVKDVINEETGLKDETYSNRILNQAFNQNIGLAFMYQNEKLRAQLGASAVPTSTYNETNGYAPYKDFRWNFSPRAMLFYDFNDNSNVRLFYWGRSSQPSTSQLLPVADNSNPLAVSLGNPYLTPYFNHRLRSDLEFSNKKTFFTMRLHVEGNYTQSPIVSAIWYDLAGRTFSLPVNGNDSFNGNLRFMVNAPIAKSNFSISNMLRLSYSKSGSYIGAASLNMDEYYNAANAEFNYSKFHSDYFTEDNRKNDKWAQDFLDNTTRSLGFTERLRATYRSDDVEVMLSGRTRMSKPWYTVQAAVAATWANQVSASFKWIVGQSGFEVSTDANYNWYRGYTTAQPSEFVWNASISQQVFRRRGTISLKAYDILDQAKNLTVTDTANYHEEVRNNTLGRYIMLSFTWRFGNFGKAGEQMR
ncbi:MAG: outer membrane beta-barrel protein, partial [Bacteroidales bacterium]|nr:outer membrane beta-barrel protein [Bacteroidales bacterium]